MSLRIPNRPNTEVSEIRTRDPGKLVSISRMLKIDASHKATLLWEQTTFVDCNGNAFYGKDGVPFQGRRG